MNGMVSYNVPHFFGEGLVPWGMLIVVHFFLSGMAAGSFIASAAASYLDDERYKKIAAAGAYLALLSIIVDVPILILDLDRPFRFITLLYRGSVTAPLTWGVWFLIGLGLFSLLNIALQRGVEAVKGSKALILVIGSVCAVGVSAYTAVALNVATNARPLWSDGAVIPVFMVASATTGIAAVSLAVSLSGGRKGLSSLNAANAVLLLFQLALVAFMLITASTSSPLSREAAGVILSGGLSLVFWIGLVTIGLVIPVIVSWSNVLAKGAEPKAGTTALISAMVLVGVLALRYIIVYGGQIIPLT
ncbi:MAG: polysulfide reductase NrfD [Deltaproteobacteria bacterium]|nr:polysulfide reductase NrfD [Deltaproteobacteria bacterium]